METMDFLSVQHYMDERSAFISEDRSLRRDAVRYAQATDDEKKADAYVRAVRSAEAKSIWSAPHEKTPNVYPGMEFLTARSVIEKTRLFTVLTKMPKGALLHCHLDATVDAQSLLKLALDQPAICVQVDRALTSSELINASLPAFKALSSDQLAVLNAVSLTDDVYVAGTWVPIKEARKNFSVTFGGPSGFDNWVTGALSINPTESYVTHTSVDRIWQKFEGVFEVSEGLVYYKPLFIEYIREMFRQSVDDGIMYTEARIMFFSKFFVGEDGVSNVTHSEWIQIFETVVNEMKTRMKQLNRPDEFFGAKIIYTTMRCITPEELEWYLEDCLALKQEFPHIIAGFDLVGPENTMFPLIHYIEPLLRFRKKVNELGIDIPYIFHAGETLGDGDEVDNNLYDAILLGTKRIGHGFSMAKHPNLLRICREKQIALEVCPISNEILRLTGSMPMHPLPIFLNNGVPVALSSDDPGIFGHMGLSFDYFQAIVASEVTGLTTLGGMARDTIEFSMLDEEDKKQALAMWERQWALYVNDIASELKND